MSTISTVSDRKIPQNHAWSYNSNSTTNVNVLTRKNPNKMVPYFLRYVFALFANFTMLLPRHSCSAVPLCFDLIGWSLLLSFSVKTCFTCSAQNSVGAAMADSWASDNNCSTPKSVSSQLEHKIWRFMWLQAFQSFNKMVCLPHPGSYMRL